MSAIKLGTLTYLTSIMVAITDQNVNSMQTKVIYSQLIILSIDVNEHYYRKLKGIENRGKHLEQ